MIDKAKLNDYRNLLIFESAVFRVPFLQLMPKIYRNKEKCTFYNRIVRENGKIIGAYAAYPSEFVTTSGSLKTVGIASVAVSKKHRGKGIMSQMLGFAEEEAKQSGADIMLLGGLRHRYERFGYIPCGEKYVCDVSSHYAKHAPKSKKYTFSPLSKCSEELDRVHSLFENRRTHWQREKCDFVEITKTWFNRCFVIFDESNHFSGYLIANHFLKEITEIVLCDPSALSDVSVSFLGQMKKDSVSLIVFPWQKELIKEINSFGENIKVCVSASFKFLSFKKPTEILMNEKLKEEILPEGTLIIKLGDETISVTVKDKKCTVTDSDETPDIELSYTEAMTALTTHRGIVSNPLFRAWSPMCPISIPSSDKV